MCPAELNSVTESPQRDKPGQNPLGGCGRWGSSRRGRSRMGSQEHSQLAAAAFQSQNTQQKLCCSDLQKYPGVGNRNVRINILCVDTPCGTLEFRCLYGFGQLGFPCVSSLVPPGSAGTQRHKTLGDSDSALPETCQALTGPICMYTKCFTRGT